MWRDGFGESPPQAPPSALSSYRTELLPGLLEACRSQDISTLVGGHSSRLLSLPDSKATGAPLALGERLDFHREGPGTWAGWDICVGAQKQRGTPGRNVLRRRHSVFKTAHIEHYYGLLCRPETFPGARRCTPPTPATVSGVYSSPTACVEGDGVHSNNHVRALVSSPNSLWLCVWVFFLMSKVTSTSTPYLKIELSVYPCDSSLMGLFYFLLS